VDFGKEIIPGAVGTHAVHAFVYRGYWADVGTIASFYRANIQLTRPNAPFNFFHPRFPIYTHPRFLPSTRVAGGRIQASIVAEGCDLRDCEIDDSVVGIRTHVGAGSKITRSVLLGADFYQEEDPGNGEIALGIGRDVVIDGAIVDKNARIADGVRLTNPDGLQHCEGEGWCVRDGIVIVPKGAVVRRGLGG
jgi:glucose-1-phosphate adenylyltransferase